MSPPLKSDQQGIAPGRKRRIPGRRREIEHLLAGSDDPAPEQVGEELGKPRPRREYEAIGLDRLTVR